MKAYNDLTASQLIKRMHSALGFVDYLAQREAMLDIADLLECADISAEASCNLTRFWGLREHGTVLARTNDFEEWEPRIIARYKITFVPDKGWGIEKL